MSIREVVHAHARDPYDECDLLDALGVEHKHVRRPRPKRQDTFVDGLAVGRKVHEWLLSGG